MTVPIAIIAAVARNRVIGRDNKIPWRLPSDFAWFKRQTLGKPLIMGRRTFEGIGKPLPGRTSVIVTNDRDYRPDGALVAHDLQSALVQAQAIAAQTGADEVMIGGGVRLYEEGMAVADRLYITSVEAEPDGDTVFPEINPQVWRIVRPITVVRDPADSVPFRVNLYERA